jgi:protein TonB
MPAALASLAILLAIVYALVVGLSYGVMAQGREALVSVFSAPPPEPPKLKQPKPRVVPAKAAAAKGDPSPRNLKNQATAVFAPALPPLIVPPPIIAALQPALGSAASSGVSDLAGPGQGAGGLGDGNGGGGTGGEGYGGGAVVGPRQIKGKLSFKDLPEGMIAPGSEARVGVRYIVEPDGRVSHCRADETSGIAALDGLACRLIEQRFRFKPARNREGDPVRATVVEAHSWFIREERPSG